MPSDDQRAQLLIEAAIDARVHAVTFTAAPAARHLFAIAAARGDENNLRAALNERVVTACVGPACAEAARELGITELVAPDVGRLGLLVRALSDRLSRRRRVLVMAGTTVELQGHAAIVADQRIRFTQREAAVLDALLARPGAVISRASLHRGVWNGDGDDHIVAVTIARLRAKLGPGSTAIRAVPRRGYRLDAETDEP
jgi:uroporphyrinogen-III synthase